MYSYVKISHFPFTILSPSVANGTLLYSRQRSTYDRFFKMYIICLNTFYFFQSAGREFRLQPHNLSTAVKALNLSRSVDFL